VIRGGVGAVGAVLVDLLMAVMDSISVWTAAAGDRARGLAWRDAVTASMRSHGRYVPYEELVARAGSEAGIPSATDALLAAWATMRPWPDAALLADLPVPYAFVTNCSRRLADEAAARSGLHPVFTLSAEEAGWYKPRREIYRLACTRIGVEPHHALFVAGSPYDADGARKAGLLAALVARRPDVEPPEGGPVIGSLAEVARALDGGGDRTAAW